MGHGLEELHEGGGGEVTLGVVAEDVVVLAVELMLLVVCGLVVTVEVLVAEVEVDSKVADRIVEVLVGILRAVEVEP